MDDYDSGVPFRSDSGENQSIMASLLRAFAAVPPPSPPPLRRPSAVRSPELSCRNPFLGGAVRFDPPRGALWRAPGSGLPPRRCRGVVSYSAPFNPDTLQWVSAISAAVLMLSKGTAIQKSFLVPLVALQAPASVISWMKGEYGTWAAFLALLVRLFYFIPGELDLPFWTMLLVIVAPYQTMNLRGSQPGAIISLVIAGYLSFQHFSRAGSLRRAFDQGSIIATLAVICITAVACLFLI